MEDLPTEMEDLVWALAMRYTPARLSGLEPILQAAGRGTLLRWQRPK